MGTRKCQLPRPAPAMTAIAAPRKAAVSSTAKGCGKIAQTVAADGTWTCVGCGNVNFAEREVCNTRKCRAPRPDLAAVVQPMSYGKAGKGTGYSMYSKGGLQMAWPAGASYGAATGGCV